MSPAPDLANTTPVFVPTPADHDPPLSELLAREPSHVTRRFLYVLLLVFVAAVVASALIRIDVTVSAPATLLPEGKALPVQPDIAGTITAVRVREGDRVAAGDVLV